MKPWTITTEDDEIHIDLPEFGETYFGDADSMIPEEWRIVRLISTAPMLLDACKKQENALASLAAVLRQNGIELPLGTAVTLQQALDATRSAVAATEPEEEAQ